MNGQISAEKNLVTCRKHWSSYIPVGIVEAMFFLIMIAGFASGDIGAGLGVFAVSTIVCGIWAASINSSYISLSTTSITGKVGLVKTVKLVAPISKIQNLSISNGLGGKIFGYHSVTVATAGTSKNEIVFKGVTNAELLQKAYIALENRVK